MKNIFIQPPTFGADKTFKFNGYRVVPSPEEADAIVFMGGEDIDPGLYSQKPILGVWPNKARDKREVALFEKYAGTKKMIGICRGAQLLNVLCGGTLWQDVTRHAIGKTHLMYHVKDNVITENFSVVNSLHHQMMRPSSKGTILGVAYEADMKQDAEQRIELPIDGTRDVTEFDTEMVFYRDLDTFCFQPHPEFEHEETENIFFKTLDDLFQP